MILETKAVKLVPQSDRPAHQYMWLIINSVLQGFAENKVVCIYMLVLSLALS